MKHVTLTAGILFLLSAFVLTGTLHAQDRDPQKSLSKAVTIWDSVFTAGQARRGERVALSECTLCHVPETEWTLLLDTWNRQSVWNLYDTIRRTMPMDFPGGLRPGEYADIVAYILRLNDAPTGQFELPSGREELSRIQISVIDAPAP